MRQHGPAAVMAWALILVALAAAVPVLGARIAIEGGNRRVEIALDHRAFAELAAAAGQESAAWMGQLAAAGATAAVVDVYGTAGLDEGRQRELQAANLALLPRLRLPSGAEAAAAAVRALGRRVPGGTTLLLTGAAVPAPAAGAPDPLAQAIRSSGYLLGLLEDPRNPESVAVPGLGQLAERLEYQAVRAYGVGPLPAGPDSPAAALARARLAVRDRNVRVLILTPFPGPDPLAANAAWIAQLVRELNRMGVAAGPPAPFPPVPLTLGQLGLIGLGPVGAGLRYLLLIWPPGWRGGTAAGLLAGAAGAAAVLWGVQAAPYTGPELLALAAAVLFPALAAGLLHRRWTGPATGRAPLTEGLVAVGATAGLGLAGGALVAALLADPRYMLQVEGFRGVKLALLLPPALAALPALLRLLPPWRPAAGGARDGAAGGGGALDGAAGTGGGAGTGGAPWRRPSAWAGALLAAAAVFWYIQRSGNLPLGGVPEWERELRTGLDQLLGVRPRFKEMLLGYPALGLAAVAATRGRYGWAAAGLVAGAVAGSSVTNTFSHIHTPLAISLVRTFHGLWLGGLLALLAGAAASLVWRRGT